MSKSGGLNLSLSGSEDDFPSFDRSASDASFGRGWSPAAQSAALPVVITAAPTSTASAAVAAGTR
jgi:hypothetical protein